MPEKTMRFHICLFLFIFCWAPQAVWADCSLSPNGTTILAPETRPTGTVIFNTDNNVLQMCASTGDWKALHAFIPAPTGCNTIGTQCSDNSFYVGNSPEDGMKVYMTSQAFEVAREFDSDSCYRCGNGTIATSITDGRANTAALLAFDPAGFVAADYCASLEAHDRDDWYLPAGGDSDSAELHLFQIMDNQVGPVDGIGATTNWYLSSTESGTSHARIHRFNGSRLTGVKDSTYRVRCVRR